MTITRRMHTIHLPETFKPTHQTAGLDGYPAVDLFAPAGTFILAPAACEIDYVHLIPWSASKRCGGMTLYIVTPRARYFVTHLDRATSEGTYKRGDVIGIIAPVPGQWWSPHVHYGRHAH